MTTTLLLAILVGQAPDAQPRPAPQNSMRIVVFDPDGKPLEGASVSTGIWSQEPEFKANRDYKTDANGIVTIELPRTYYILRIWASKKPFVSMYANWEKAELGSGKLPPEEYSFRLEKAVTAGGRIVDGDGKPIEGAKVQLRMSNDPKPVYSDGRVRYSGYYSLGDSAKKTDADGRWRVDNVPDHPEAQYSLLISHPDYASDEIWGESQKAAGITTAMLRNETATITLKRGVVIRGHVVDPQGNPVKDAVVILGDRPYFSNHQSRFLTDADGTFRLPAVKPQQTNLTVIARGWAPQIRKLNLQADQGTQEFRLAPGKPIKLHVVDATGKPFPNAYVTIRSWRGSESIQSHENPNQPKVGDLKIPGRTDADGNWEWTWAPDDPVKISVNKPGFADSEFEIAGGEPARTIVLKPEHRITGRVTDAITGQPIQQFTVMPVDVFRGDWLVTERYNGFAGQHGEFSFRARRTDIPIRLRVEAIGYRSQDGPEFRLGDDSPRTQEFRLQRSPPITGIVLDHAGRPLADAEVMLATPTESVELRDPANNNTKKTDAAGRFQFPDPGEPFIVVARTDAGYAQAEFPKGTHDAGTLKLQPWASIRGVFQYDGKPVAGATIFANPIDILSTSTPQVEARQEMMTGPDGRFEFTRLPPGRTSVNVYLGPWRDDGFRSAPRVPLDLKPGQKVELDLGGLGATIAGKVNLAGKVPADLNCTYSINHLVRREAGIDPPSEIAQLGFDARKGWNEMWLKTPEGRAFFSTLRTWFVKLAPDGSFRISGVPAGEYDLVIAVYAKPSGCLIDPLGRNVVRVTVTDDDVRRGRIEVPEIPVEIAPVPEIGDAPALSFAKADGTAGSLADARGKLTLVHFWASWCAPCKQQLPAVRKLHIEFAAKGLTTLGLSLDDDVEAWRRALTSLELPWPQGRLPVGNDAGVSSVPAYWLLDAQGKIVAKVYDTGELAKAIAERVK